MATPQELEKLLNDMRDAKAELKTTISEARQARKELLEAQKQHRQRITDLIAAEITNQIGVLADRTKADMKHAIENEVQRVVAEWRRALKLDQ